MDISEHQDRIHKLLTHDLPDPNTLISKGQEIAEDTTLGRSLFCEKMGVFSEAAFKAQCIADGTIMYHTQIGMGSWSTTTDALRHIHQIAQDEGYRIDRAGICLDRRMAVPVEFRDGIPAETGPMLTTPADWTQVGQTAPIQPHMGDFMIGFPAAVENTVHALKAGVTTIGNLSQYFSHEAPSWDDPIHTVAETVKAVAILGARRDDGLILHSYLEDGFGALFRDCTTVAGWAYLERYIVEELLGARLTHCIGGLTSDPVKRVGWVFALDTIHDRCCLGSMIYGDTISFTHNFPRNQAVVGEYLLWDILAQLECPTGHAVHPLPITEALRIPTAEEISEIHTFGRQVEATARRMHPYIDFGPARSFSHKIVPAGKYIFDRAINGLRDFGVNVTDPVELLYVLKSLGPYVFETTFGLGAWDDSGKHRVPVVPTDMFQRSTELVEQNLPQFSTEKITSLMGHRRLLLASTDVHEHALFVLGELLSHAGAEIINLGAEQNPVDIAEVIGRIEVDAVLISTHNGMALEYAQQLKAQLEKRQIDVPVLMGGVLNQKMENHVLPVDVRQELHQLGFQTSSQLQAGWKSLLLSGEN